MSQATTRTDWSWDEYLAWETLQDGRHELVNGQVIAMTGGTRRHNQLCVNLLVELQLALGDGPCRVYGMDFKVRAGDNARYPDALIDCGRLIPEELVADQPVAVFEVLSRSTAWIDQTSKLRDYGRLQSIQSYVLISQDAPWVLHYMRADAASAELQRVELLEGLGQSLKVTGLDVTLPLERLYARSGIG